MKKASKKAVIAIIAVVAIGVAAGAFALTRTPHGEIPSYFYIQGTSLYCARQGAEPLSVSQVLSGSADQDSIELVKTLTSMEGDRITYPVLREGGRGYDLYEKQLDEETGTLLLESVTTVDALEEGELLLQSKEGALYSYRESELRQLASSPSDWGIFEKGNGAWYVEGGALFAYDGAGEEPREIASETRGDIVASPDGSSFRYKKGEGAQPLYFVYCGGSETELPKNAQIVAEESADRFYFAVRRDSARTMGDFVVDDLAAEKNLKAPDRDDFAEDVYNLTFVIERASYDYLWNRTKLPNVSATFREDSTVAQGFHAGRTSALTLINSAIQGGDGEGSQPFTFTYADLKRLEPYFGAPKTGRSASTYSDVVTHGTEGYAGFGGMSYDVYYTAKNAGKGNYDEEAFSRAVAEYSDTAQRNLIRAELGKSFDEGYTLYRFSPENGIETVVEKAYEWSVEGEKLVVTPTETPETYPPAVPISSFTYQNDVKEILKQFEELRDALMPKAAVGQDLVFELAPAEDTEPSDNTEIPDALLEANPGLIPVAKGRGQELLYYVKTNISSGSLYLYDGKNSTQVASGVCPEGWAGTDARTVAYLADVDKSNDTWSLYLLNGKKSEPIMSGVTALWQN